MANLFIYNNKIESIFQLLGEKEDHISYSVGYCLSKSNEFLKLFLKHINVKSVFDPTKIVLRLQEHKINHGRTDFEISQEGEFHIIIEAKKGWNFPKDEQLNRYAQRLKNSIAKEKRVFIFNESTTEYVDAIFSAPNNYPFDVDVISWSKIKKMADTAQKTGTNAEKKLLSELAIYLDKISIMQKKDSNMVWIVPLAHGNPVDWSISWVNIVQKKRMYFHPIGGRGYKVEPPNYIAFRHGGQLLSIHHIDNYVVFKNPRKHFREAPDREENSRYLYYLGEAIKPLHNVKYGEGIIKDWKGEAMIDLLLTCKTVREAVDKTKERIENQI